MHVRRSCGVVRCSCGSNASAASPALALFDAESLSAHADAVDRRAHVPALQGRARLGWAHIHQRRRRWQPRRCESGCVFDQLLSGYLHNIGLLRPAFTLTLSPRAWICQPKAQPKAVHPAHTCVQGSRPSTLTSPRGAHTARPSTATAACSSSTPPTPAGPGTRCVCVCVCVCVCALITKGETKRERESQNARHSHCLPWHA
jgi:hypothetical protein